MTRCACGQEVPQGWSTCPFCGRAVLQTDQNQPALMGPTTAGPVLQPQAPEPMGLPPGGATGGGTGSKKLAIVVGILVGVVLVISILWTSIGPGGFLPGTSNNKAGSNPVAIINTTMGTITIVLYKDKVPNTVDNFEKYARANFYSGLIFHRVANLDMTRPDTHIIQGGGLNSTMGTKTALYPPIKLEINAKLTHVDGAVAMARTSDPDSATSQFYVCDGEQHFLDDSVMRSQAGVPGYAVFGKVTSGMTIVRAMGKVATDTYKGYDDVPLTPIIINSVTVQE